MTPSKDQAYQFAVMLSAGSPAREAIRYFLPEDQIEVYSSAQAEQIACRWLADKEVQRVVVLLQGKDWTEMSTEERMRFSLDKTYVEMAYFLYSRNYVDLAGQEKAKADTCRAALESKLAGTAGKLNAVEQFWSDVMAGKVKLIGSGVSSTLSPLTSQSLGGPKAQTQAQAGEVVEAN